MSDQGVWETVEGGLVWSEPWMIHIYQISVLDPDYGRALVRAVHDGDQPFPQFFDDMVFALERAIQEMGWYE